jgi:serine/threonine protein kinase
LKEIDILSELSRLNSEFIIKFYKYNHDLKNKNIAIVLEHGICTLQEILDEVEKSNGEFHFEISHFFDILLHLLQAFLVAKDHGICNRDIKPDNILCCPIYSNSVSANFENIFFKLGD